MYPLDTLKTRIQSPDYSRLYLNAGKNTVNKAALFRGLYQGIGSVILATLPSCMLRLYLSLLLITDPYQAGAFFTTYEGVKHVLSTANPSTASGSHLVPEPIIHSAASSVGELVSCAILTPAEVIKQNAQMVRVSRGGQNATLQTIKKFRSNPLALWRGYTALVGRNLPFTALQFPMFERLKVVIRSHRDRNGTRTGTLLESGTITAISAGSAGSVAAVITTPIDVVKTRIMLSAVNDAAREASSGPIKAPNSGNNGIVDAVGNTIKKGKDGVIGIVDEVAQGSKKRKSSWSIAQEVMKEQGFKGLWRGGALRGVWTMIGSGLYLGVYESGRIWLATRRGDSIAEDELL